ncbi:unnamed protein product [Cochlearia groenlandica]
MVDPILANIFGIFGNVVSFCVFLAPLICHNKSTESFQCVPYLVSLFSCTLWVLYALMKDEVDLLFSINAIGTLVQLIYISIFVVYASTVKRMFISLNIFLYGDCSAYATTPLSAPCRRMGMRRGLGFRVRLATYDCGSGDKDKERGVHIPNVLGLAFGIGQMIMYAFYRKKEDNVGEIELIV